MKIVQGGLGQPDRHVDIAQLGAAMRKQNILDNNASSGKRQTSCSLTGGGTIEYINNKADCSLWVCNREDICRLRLCYEGVSKIYCDLPDTTGILRETRQLLVVF